MFLGASCPPAVLISGERSLIYKLCKPTVVLALGISILRKSLKGMAYKVIDAFATQNGRFTM